MVDDAYKDKILGRIQLFVNLQFLFWPLDGCERKLAVFKRMG